MTEQKDCTATGPFTSLHDIKTTAFVIACGGGHVSISVETGKVTFVNCTPDEAARSFWDAVELMFPGRRYADDNHHVAGDGYMTPEQIAADKSRIGGDLPDDWFIEETGERLILDQEKVAAEIKRLRAAPSTAEIDAAAHSIFGLEWDTKTHRAIAQRALEAAAAVRRSCEQKVSEK